MNFHFETWVKLSQTTYNISELNKGFGMSDIPLYQAEKNVYGTEYTNHYFEQYKIFVEMADRISSRRYSANSFFLTVNTAVIALIGYLDLGKNDLDSILYWLISIAGMTICFLWYRLIVSFKELNSQKFKIIQEMEKNLPLAPYTAEWNLLKNERKAKKKYNPFTATEKIIPIVFGILHLFVFQYAFYNAMISYIP